MWDTVAGLPVHPLVVHAVVVLLPLTCLGAVAVAVVPTWNRRFGVLLVGTAAAATGASLVAWQSGKALATRVGLPEQHYAIARWIPLTAGILLLCVGALWWTDRSPQEGGRTGAARFLAAATVLVALVALGWVVAAGHTGATAVWRQIVENTQPGSVSVD